MDKNTLNKPLIIFSAFFSVIYTLSKTSGSISQIQSSATTTYILVAAAMLIAYPIVAIWFKALWNEIAYKIFNLPIINAWQAAGILSFISFLLV